MLLKWEKYIRDVSSLRRIYSTEQAIGSGIHEMESERKKNDEEQNVNQEAGAVRMHVLYVSLQIY